MINNNLKLFIKKCELCCRSCIYSYTMLVKNKYKAVESTATQF